MVFEEVESPKVELGVGKSDEKSDTTLELVEPVYTGVNLG